MDFPLPNIPPSRTQAEIIAELKSLVSTKGYLYAVCLILFEDFHIIPEKLHETNCCDRLSHNEAAFILGFLIQNELDFSRPENPEKLFFLKRRTCELMRELHGTFKVRFLERLKAQLEVGLKAQGDRGTEKDFFGKGEMLVEPIFYAGTGAYDFQFEEFLEEKYKYDIDWLAANKRYDIPTAKKIIAKIKESLNRKAEQVHPIEIRERLPGIIEKLKRNPPVPDWEEKLGELLPALELYQYVHLFGYDKLQDGDGASQFTREELWDSFYAGLIDLFVVERKDFEQNIETDAFFENFSVVPGNGINSEFAAIGDYNLITSHPLIRIEDGRFLVPLTFFLCKAVYDRPFYWMTSDDSYRDAAGEHRGRVAEEICNGFLSKVFGANRTFRSVKIRTRRGDDATDIDVLCVLGSKALCVQIKSKRLTLLAQKGNDEALSECFKGAIQDAYNQGILARKRILAKDAAYFDAIGNEIVLSEKIDDVYVAVITAEEYPSLAHQTRVLLHREAGAPFPIVINVFDLELLCHYLQDPYDFLYYVRQRIALMDYCIANEESIFLGYHLIHKLWKVPGRDREAIDDSFGQLIVRNYYPLRAKIPITDDGDAIKHKRVNPGFNRLCNRLKMLKEPKITDVIFCLMDLSEDARDSLLVAMQTAKQKTISDGRRHDFSIPPDDLYGSRLGFTYISFELNSSQQMRQVLMPFCQLRKYKSRGDIWVGFGSVKDSNEIIDAVAFNNTPWRYDATLEEMSAVLLTKGQYKVIGHRPGRNEPCPCGSGRKYKRCCANRMPS